MGYEKVIRTTTKNLFDISKANVTQLDGCFYLNRGSTSNFYTLAVTPGEKYTVSYETYSVDGWGSALNLSVQTGDFYHDGTQLAIILNHNKEWGYLSFTITIPDGATKITLTGLRGSSYYRNFMVENGETATPYTPYNYLQSYIRKTKVSNVCQIALISDKETATDSNVTFTNNKDGSWTVSGKSDSKLGYSYCNLFLNLPLKQGHVYLNSAVGSTGTTYCEQKFKNKDNVVLWSANPYTADENSKVDLGILRHVRDAGSTQIVYCQIIDLTETFGPGNEPKTVAKFRERFPNGYYPYSPSCWIISYRDSVVCKTKNLMTDEMFTSVGFTKQDDGSWYIPDSSALDKKVMWENTEGIEGDISMSFYGRSSLPNNTGVIQWLVEDVNGDKTYRTSTGTSSEWTYCTWSFDSRTVSKVYWVNITGRPLYLRDVMLEWGSTATSYVPYYNL